MRTMLKCIAIVLIASAAFAAPDTTTKPASDPRLDQPVTIDCANMRLHSVLDKISEQTGVTIRCGKNANDWQVRDIPIVVCVKDLPLGKLLSYLTECTHTALLKEKVGDAVSYKVSQNAKLQKEIDAYYVAKKNAYAEKQKQDWDAVCAMKNLKELKADPNNRNSNPLISSGLAQSLAAILSGLDAATDDWILDGGSVTLQESSVPEPLKATFRDTMSSFRRYYETAYPRVTLEEMSDHLLESGNIRIETDGGDSDAGASTYVRLELGHYEIIGLSELADIARHTNGESKIDIENSLPRVDGQMPDKWDCPTPDWFANRVVLDPLKNPKSATAADVMVSLAHARGLNLITEDFVSHDTESFLSKEIMAAAGMETKLGCALPRNYAWRFNDPDKALIGYSGRWISDHRCLLPEAMYNSLLDKVTNSEVTLDDMLPLADINEEQASTWLFNRSEFSPLRQITEMLLFSKPLWALYYHLSPSYRARAASADGLPLAALDMKAVSDAITTYTRQHKDQTKAYVAEAYAMAADTDLLTRGVMKLYIVNAHLQYDETYAYSLVLSSEKAGEQYVIGSERLDPLPIYSRARAAELAKKASEGTPASPTKK